MIETNIKIVEFGPDLKLFAKRITLKGNELNPKQIQAVCGQIGRRYNIAATPNSIEKGKQQVLIYQYDNVPAKSITIDNWTVTPLTDDTRLVLSFSIKEHQQLIADLYKRSLLLHLNQNSAFWRLDSPRIFFEKEPLPADNREYPDIDAFRKYEISEVIVEGVGLGFSVDVSTAFFTNLTVDDYFSSGHEERFKNLSGRQGEQKGTLMYDGPNKKVKCYFVKYYKDTTLLDGHSFKINGGREYDNPYDYFKERYPHFEVESTDRVAKVSFPMMSGPVDVPANRLYLRVMNNMLPNGMKNLDKIAPKERERLLTERFWDKLGDFPFGKGFRKLQNNYYCPAHDKGGTIPLPDLKFGETSVLSAPASTTSYEYQNHFKKRKRWINSKGCYHVPPQMERQIIVTYPSGLNNQIIEKYADDICQRVAELTNIPVEPVITKPYDTILEAAYQLRDEAETGMVLFIFDNHDPATYYHISRELKGWRIKRATSRELEKKYRGFSNNFRGKGIKNWESYIEFTAYDVVEQLGCVPYIMSPVLNYDMQLVIDVSEKSSHFGLSLMLYNENTNVPLFQCQVHPKHDPKNKETINHVLLEKYLMNLFNSIGYKLEKANPSNLLILRDGKDCKEEYQAIVSVISKLKEKGSLNKDFSFDFAEYHKTSRKGIRIWEKNRNNIQNALEGSYVLLGKNRAIVTSTGGGSLRQGTASPLLIVAKHSPNADIKKIVEDVFISSQLNFASPGVAQRLTFAAKRVDDQLKERRAQEVERIN